MVKEQSKKANGTQNTMYFVYICRTLNIFHDAGLKVKKKHIVSLILLFFAFKCIYHALFIIIGIDFLLDSIFFI